MSAISIQEFWDPQYSVGVKVLPEVIGELESADPVGNEEEIRELRAIRDQWAQDGKFVWWWAKEYWVGKEGEVEST